MPAVTEAPATEPVSEKRKRKPSAPKPGEVTKRKLTIAEAADEWEFTEVELRKLAEKAAPLKARHGAAEEVLLAHFDRTGNATYKGRISWHWSGTRLILDQGKVSKYLGRKLPDFQKRTESKRVLDAITAEPPA